MDDDDKYRVIQDLIKILALISESDTNKGKDWKDIRNLILHRPLDQLPKGNNGKNTITSFVGGLVNNLVFGTQRDFSVTQLEAISYITSHLNVIYPEIKILVFEEE